MCARDPMTTVEIDTGWRDWHRLEDGHCGLWAMRCRQVVPMLPRGVDGGVWDEVEVRVRSVIGGACWPLFEVFTVKSGKLGSD